MLGAAFKITSPDDGSSADSTTVVVSGTESPNVEPLVRVYVDGVLASVTTATDGQWSVEIPVDWGTHEICAEKSDALANPIASDCITSRSWLIRIRARGSGGRSPVWSPFTTATQD